MDRGNPGCWEWDTAWEPIPIPSRDTYCQSRESVSAALSLAPAGMEVPALLSSGVMAVPIDTVSTGVTLVPIATVGTGVILVPIQMVGTGVTLVPMDPVGTGVTLVPMDLSLIHI